MTVEEQVLGREFVKHVFKSGVSALHNTLATGIVGYTKLVGDGKFAQKIMELRRGVSGTVISFKSLGGSQNREAMHKMGDNIASSLTSVEGGAKKTTEGINGDMNVLEGAKRGVMSNISLPEGAREKSPGVGAR